MQEPQPAGSEEVVEGEAVEYGQEEEAPIGIGHDVEIRKPEQPVGTLFGTSDPQEVVARVTQVATTLKDILKQQKLTQRIGTNDHVKVEGWQTLGSMIGVFPVKETVEEIPWPQPMPQSLTGAFSKGLAFGFKASYRAQTLSGAVVGGAEGICKRTESKWVAREDYALMSMAQTRAMSKALKAPLGFIVTMAGYEATPVEEMDGLSNEGAYGPAMSLNADDTLKLSKAMIFLINDAALATGVRDTIIKEAGGYFPRIVHRALLHTAVAARDGSQQPTTQEEPNGSDGDDPGYDG